MNRAELIDDELREAFRVEAHVTLQAVGPQLALLAVDGHAEGEAIRALAEAAHKIRGGALVLGLTTIADRIGEVELLLRQELATPGGRDLRSAVATLMAVEQDCASAASAPVEAPIAAVRPAAVEPEVANRHRPTRVLQIEDDMVNVLLVRRILERKRPDVQLVHFQQARDGLAFAVAQQPSLILLDLHLPDMSGEEVLAALRADERTRTIPVVVVSGDVERSRHGNAGSGPTSFLAKPFAMDELLAAVGEACGPLEEPGRA